MRIIDFFCVINKLCNYKNIILIKKGYLYESFKKYCSHKRFN